MKSAPCVRLAMRISPKMSENPAARRKSNPPSARLLSVCIAQYCNQGSSEKSSPRRRGRRVAPLTLKILGGRPVARIHRVLEELIGLVGPELAHVRIGVDHRVDEAPFLARDL